MASYSISGDTLKRRRQHGATFAVIAVVPRDKVSVTAHGEKLAIVDDRPGAL
jgi:hypothetical protein